MRSTQERLLVKVQPSCSRDPRILEMPAAVVERSQLEPKDKLCAEEGRDREVTQVLWRSPEDREWIPATGLLEFGLILFACDCAQSFPS